MTVPAGYAPLVYAGNGSTATFPFTWPLLAAAHLVVVLTDDAGNDTTLAKDVDYTLTWSGVGQTGSITLDTPPAIGETLTVSRAVTVEQPTDLRSQGKITAEVLERAYDRLCMIAQETVTRLLDHADLHGPGASSALPWPTIHGYGPAANRPTASASLDGYLYFSYDVPTLERCNGSTWQTYGAGDPGPGVPAGGTTGQVLAKSSATDYHTEWKTLGATDVGADPAGTAASAVAAHVAAADPHPTYSTAAETASAVGTRQPYHGVANRDALTLSYSSVNRQFTITGSAQVYIAGTLYTFASPTSAAHANATGVYYWYVNAAGALTVSDTFWDLEQVAPLAAVFFNATLGVGIPFYELHHAHRDPLVHKRLHLVDGTQVVQNASTFLISGYTLNSDADADKGFSIGSGDIMDEDITRTMTALTEGAYRRFYRSGASGEWTFDTANATFPFFDDGTSIQYNQFTGATWQKTALSGTQFVNYWVICLPALDAHFQIIVIAGQAVHATQAAAEAESIASLAWGNVPFQEMAPLYQITYRHRAANANQGKADIVRVARLAGSRTSIVTSGATPTVAAAVTVVPAGGIASTNAQAALEELDAEKAPLASPALTGTPTAPTAAAGTSTTQIATTAFAKSEAESAAVAMALIFG